MIEVFFTSGHRAKLDDRTPFHKGGSVFDFTDAGDTESRMGEILNVTGALVNWDAVAWVRRVVETDDD